MAKYGLLAVLIALLAMVPLTQRAGAATVTVCDSGCDHTTIQAAVDAADPNDEISVDPGTYTDPVEINVEGLTIVGAGDGDSGSDTIIDVAGAGDAVQISADNVTIKDLRIDKGANEGRGLHVNVPTVNNLSLDGVTVTGASNGFRVGSGSTVDGLLITNSHFDGNRIAWYIARETSASSGAPFTNINVSTTTFNGNTDKGIYAEKMSNAIFDNITVEDSGTNPAYGFNAGIDINLKWAAESNITIQNSSIINSGLSSGTEPNPLFPVGLTIKARDDGSYSPGATLVDVLVDNVTVTGGVNGIRFGEPGVSNAGPTNVTVQNSMFTGQTGVPLSNESDASLGISGNIVNVSDGQSVDDAVYAAGDNGDVNLAAGNYSSFTVDEPGVKVDGGGDALGGVPSAVVTGRVDVAADGVIIDGLSVTNPTGGYGIVSSGVNNLQVLNNYVYDIGTDASFTGTSSTAQAIYVDNGNAASNLGVIDIQQNVIEGVGNPESGSAKGIFVGDSVTTFDLNDVTIANNRVSGLRAKADAVYSGGGRGANGVQVNWGGHPGSGGGQVTNLDVRDNEFSDMEAFWVHMVGLETDTPGALVENNTFSDAFGTKVVPNGDPEVVDTNDGDDVATDWRDEAAVFLEYNAGPVTVEDNSFAADIAWGVVAHPGNVSGTPSATATSNWWGSATGPSGDGPGSGAGVQDDATPLSSTYDKWLCSGTDTSTDIGFQPTTELCPVDAPPGTVPGDFDDSTSEVLEDTQTAQVTVTGGTLEATFSGSGEATVFLGEYSGGSTPGDDANGFLVGDTVLDVYVAGVSDPNATLTVTMPCEADDVLRYWDGSDWKQVRSHPDATIPSCGGGTISVTFGAESLPTLSNLTGTPVSSGDPTAIEIQIEAGPVAVGDEVTVDVVLKATDFQGADVTLTYDDSVLSITDTVDVDLYPTGAGDNTVDNIFQVIKSVTPSGEVAFAYAIQGGSVSGDEIVLARITFDAVGTAASTSVGVDSLDVELSDSDGFTITPVTLDDSDTVSILAAVDVSGVVTLQGRTNHGGAEIIVENSVPAQVGSDTTDSTGAFSFTASEAGTVTRYAIMPGYLRAQSSTLLTNGSNVFPTIQLLGGDANGDAQISINDLTLIASHYQAPSGNWNNLGPLSVGGADPEQDRTPDINGDGAVTINDLTVTAANYNTSAASVW